MEPVKHIGFEIKTISNLIKRHFDASSAKQYADNLTGVHGWVIGYLYRRRDEDVFQRDLEENFSIRRSTATAILQLMEKNGLITRERVASDARLKKLKLTPKALEIQEKIMKEIDAFEELMIRGISPEEKDAFLQTLEKIKKNIEDKAE